MSGEEGPRPLPGVSVVIPARDAARWIAATLDAVAAQTHQGWEVVVVDDGSSDETAAIVTRRAAGDSRIRLVPGPGRGVSAARNVGLGEARGPLLLFLDADDLVRPRHLELLAAALDREPAAVAAHCGWARLTPRGALTDEVQGARAGDLYPEFAHHCLFPIHACLARADAVREVGGFDESLVTCEDWDLWVRLTRLGRPFAGVDEVLALYRMRPRSASLDGVRMLHDGLVVLDRARAPDPRLPVPEPPLGSAFDDDLAANRYYHLCWAAGLALGAGAPTASLVALLEGRPAPFLDAEVAAHCLFTATPLPACLSATEWPDLHARTRVAVDAFLAELERASGATEVAVRIEQALARRVLAADPSPGPTQLGGLLGVDLDLERPVEDVRVASGIARLVVRPRLAGERLAAVELPVCDGVVPARLIADAVTAVHAWAILGRFLAGHVYPEVERIPAGDALTLRRGGVVLGTVPQTATPDVIHEAIGWTTFLQELFARPEWELDRFYPSEPSPPHLAAGPVAAVEVSAAQQPLEGPKAWATIAVTVGGEPIGLVAVPLRSGKAPAAAVIRAIVAGAGYELVRAAVRRGLLGADLTGEPSLRTRLGVTAAETAAATDAAGALVLGRRRPELTGGAASRVASLPVGAAEALAALGLLADEPVRAPDGAPTHVLYDPAWLDPSGSVDHAATPGPTASARHASGRGRLARLRRRLGGGGSAVGTRRPPILMYHSVAPDGPAALARYRLHPDRFEEQLRLLRDEGFRTAPLREVEAALRARRPLAGRTVTLTFDDGFGDFAEHAWPLLQAFGFTATVFVVTDRVGASNTWDAAFGELPLLDWEALRALARDGVEIGSHTCSHPRLTTLGVVEATLELARSRAALVERLGLRDVPLAYPYGDVDGAVRVLAGGCGYACAVTVEHRTAELVDDPLALPRLEVTGSESLEDFARSLEPPDR